jgi:predicted nuclease of predicted toxin-antitoxin system
MKLLLDQGLPWTAVRLLRQASVDTIHVREIDYTRADDVDILEKGRQEGRCVVSIDADFHTILALTGATTPSAIRIRIEGLQAQQVAELLIVVINQCRADLEVGAVVTVQPNRIRVRRLPQFLPSNHDFRFRDSYRKS